MVNLLASVDWNVVLEYGAKILGSMAATLVITLGSILFAKLKAKLQDSKLKLFIDSAVKAAEQLYPNLGKKTGAEKYQYVYDLVTKKYPKVENEYLKALIEGAVFSVSEEIKQVAQAQNVEIKTEQQISIG